MTRPNENGPGEKLSAGLAKQTSEAEILNDVPASPLAPEFSPEVATRAKQRARQQIPQNRFVSGFSLPHLGQRTAPPLYSLRHSPCWMLLVPQGSAAI